ncbi:hypothetical protein BO82DRAFT_395718 [Aspergillus uvarum CBS 121591]|uniref:Glycosyltransferase family 31 protein n=1 Tax=Aspergillus uvarum CBS 121591 TaxID=1448315 RepID=A0A319BTL3_9EURO|nr:hypothetical protein BO82DRAFT_395718 [Aspergillus uvarum CBS 121591]PYH76986.1 hypothetical protein BO82DRAFT_395718 [Aspergillus uvarum CBS 121591]
MAGLLASIPSCQSNPTLFFSGLYSPPSSCTLRDSFYETRPAAWSTGWIANMHSLHSPTNEYHHHNPNASFIQSNARPDDRRCSAFPDPGNVLLVIKTGATEIYEKLPTQLLTTLGCSRNYLIFSDLEERIGPYHIQDALADYDPSLKESLPNFSLYCKQQEYRRTGQDIATLRKDGREAWTLDKYKFLHMVEMTWRERPSMDWYVFIETDTYLVWSNLLLWLQTLSADEALYMGSVAYLDSEPFAHGGSGYVISRKLMERFVGADPGVAGRYDGVFEPECCGDVVLARTIKKETDVGVQNFWPQVNGEKPATLPFGPSHWCQPVVTMHHVEPRERSSIFAFEQARENISEPLLFRQLSELAFPSHAMPEEEEDWDNFSNVPLVYLDGEVPTLETCRVDCLNRNDCFQYRYSSGECHVLTGAFQRGTKREAEPGRRWISGWNVKKIQSWRESQICVEPEWVKGH